MWKFCKKGIRREGQRRSLNLPEILHTLSDHAEDWYNTRDYLVLPVASPSPMGVKVLQCFSWYRRCKERSKSRQCPPEAGPPEEQKPRLTSTASWGSESEGHGTHGFYSHKARVSFRHQMDGNLSAIDATY